MTTEIKSRERVRDHGEVFTPEQIVNDMIALIPDEAWANPRAPIIEPTCGNGNFIMGVLAKLTGLGIYIEDALHRVFGLDIMYDNIIECHTRVFAAYLKDLPDDKMIKCLAILANNIIMVKDALTVNFARDLTMFEDLSPAAKAKRIAVARMNQQRLLNGKAIVLKPLLINYRRTKGEVRDVPNVKDQIAIFEKEFGTCSELHSTEALGRLSRLSPAGKAA